MPMGKLQGRRIVVTRPHAQAEKLCEAIIARGGEPVRFPVLAISPVADDADMVAAVARLDDFDLAFFVSPNAVQYALDFIMARRSWPAHVAVATVGKGSERVLGKFGFERVIAPQSGFDSESVLALPEFGADAIAGRHVAIFRGDGGRNLLGETLVARGAHVDYVTCYRRHCPDLDPLPLLDMARRGDIDAITLTSSEGVHNLVEMVGRRGIEMLMDIPVFAPHPRIVGFARRAGFTDVVETAPGDAGLMEAIETRFG
jgi:uroporphyrinogen-III synthase